MGKVTNIIRLDDADLHKFHAYAKFLLKKLPKRKGGGPVFLDDKVSLQYYRVQKIFEGSITREQSDPLPNKYILVNRSLRKKKHRFLS